MSGKSKVSKITYRTVTHPGRVFHKGYCVYSMGDIEARSSSGWNWDVDAQRTPAIVAMAGPRNVVGVFRYTANHGNLRAHGTWVHRKYRGEGIATEMWKRVMRTTSAKKVNVYAVSDLGHTLVNGIIDWNSRRHKVNRTDIRLCSMGERALRDLRKNKK